MGGNNDNDAIVTFNWNSMQYTSQPAGNYFTFSLNSMFEVTIKYLYFQI